MQTREVTGDAQIRPADFVVAFADPLDVAFAGEDVRRLLMREGQMGRGDHAAVSSVSSVSSTNAARAASSCEGRPRSCRI